MPFCHFSSNHFLIVKSSLFEGQIGTVGLSECWKENLKFTFNGYQVGLHNEDLLPHEKLCNSSRYFLLQNMLFFSIFSTITVRNTLWRKYDFHRFNFLFFPCEINGYFFAVTRADFQWKKKIINCILWRRFRYLQLWLPLLFGLIFYAFWSLREEKERKSRHESYSKVN